MTYIKYSDWNPLPLTGNANRTTAKRNRTHSAAHWDGGETPKTAKRSAELLRAYDRYHRYSADAIRNNRGGIAYGHAICPVTGDIYECRGFDRIHAAVGGKNTTDYSYIIIGGPGNFTVAARNGVRRLRKLEIAHFGRKLTSTTHRRRVPTTCPGNDWDSWVMSGGPDTPFEPGPAGGGGDPFPVPTPAIPIESEEDDMKPKIIFRNEGNPEWSLVHPDYRGPSELERGYLVTTDENRAIAWARVHGNGWGTPGTYTANVDREGYVEIQAAARAEYDAKKR